MVTAYGEDERRRHVLGLGAFDFIIKPVDFDQLKAQLRQLTRRRSLIPAWCVEWPLYPRADR
jgi:DNA-binding response OmpR family regulator